MECFIDNMSDNERNKYMERSVRALNGIRKLSNENKLRNIIRENIKNVLGN